MAVQDVIRWFLPSEDEFFGMLEEQGRVGHDASTAFLRFTEGESKQADEVRDSVQALEHDGDAIVHRLEDALARKFVTPLDREDIHRLAIELDDVIDFVNLAIRACTLYGLGAPTQPMKDLAKVLMSCTEIIKATLPHLRKHEYIAIIEDARTLRKLEKEGDTVFRKAVSELFRDPAVDAKAFLREKEILGDIEAAIDRCDRIAGTLTNIAVKHG
ncbi:MAG: DUF47 family protein [Deltaproteobacteria bacterium]|nr:DUF47 family protein [Deltaproteobacteria bacterium]